MLPAQAIADQLRAGGHGSVTLHNEARAVIRMTLRYRYDDLEFLQETETLGAGAKARLSVPRGAGSVEIRVEEAMFLRIWKAVHCTAMTGPGHMLLRVTGSTLATRCEERITPREPA